MSANPEVDFEAVASGVLDAIRPVVEREMKEAANQLYGATLEAVQDYLSDNASFNIRSRLDAAERDRRAQWERAEAAMKISADLLEALTALEGVAKFGGLPIQGELEDARAAIAKARGAA